MASQRSKIDVFGIPLVENIMARLSVEDLMQARSVSKAWKSLIESRRFIMAHSHLSKFHTHHLLVANLVSWEKARFLSYIDDDTFPRQPSPLTVPSSVNRLECLYVMGSSHGLIGVHGFYPNYHAYVAVVWNPSIGKSVTVPVPELYLGLLAFGVCPDTADPKFLSFTHCEVAHGQVAFLYKLSSKMWTRPSTTVTDGDWSQSISTSRFIYSRPVGKEFMSFDLSLENFKVVDIPEHVPCHQPGDTVYTSKIGDSLALIISGGTMCGVYILEDDAFSYLFNVDLQSPKDRIQGFTKSGRPILVQTNRGDRDDMNDDEDEDEDDDDYVPPTLVVYDHDSRDTKVIDVPDLTIFVDVPSYTETLLLLHCNSD